ncbi:MAG TPA: ABC transporter substrate-binding protein [Thermoplasmata archaeon]|nr:ABC transporter substrate-binding protein [Thermoplasmata archaeon]
MKRSILIAIVVVIVIVIIGAAVAVVLLTAPPRTLKIDLWYNSTEHYGPTEPAVAQVLKSSLEATGKLTVNLRSEPWTTYTDDFGNQRLPFFLLGWYPDYFDSDDYVSPFLSTSGAASLGSGYNDSQMNTWLAQEAASTDDTVRAGIFQQIQNKLATDVPYIPLWQNPSDVEYSNTVSDVFLHPVSVKWFVMNKTGATAITGGTTDSITSMDPASAYDYFSIEMINQLFDTLLVYDTQATTLVPGLATVVPTVANGGISTDGMTFTYHLRPNVKFADGTDFNSTVMKWSIDRAIKLNIPGSAAFLLYDVGALGRSQANGNNTPVGAITTPDPATIVFHLSRPVGFFNGLMAFSVSAPVSMKAYNNTGQQLDAVGKVVGTGPYNLTSYTPSQQVIMTANPNYYQPGLYAARGIPRIPVLNQVTLTLSYTAQTLKQAIETHAIDVAYRSLLPADILDLKNRATSLNLKVDIGTNPRIRYLVFNVHTAPFNDVRLRQAIAYAVDRQVINTTVFGGLSVPIYSMVPAAMPYSLPVFQTVYGSSPNLAQAKSLLAQLGYFMSPGILIARDRE